MGSKLQAKIDGFVLRNIRLFDEEQLIGLMMLHLNMFYDDAKKCVEKSISSLFGIK